MKSLIKLFKNYRKNKILSKFRYKIADNFLKLDANKNTLIHIKIGSKISHLCDEPVGLLPSEYVKLAKIHADFIFEESSKNIDKKLNYFVFYSNNPDYIQTLYYFLITCNYNNIEFYLVDKNKRTTDIDEAFEFFNKGYNICDRLVKKYAKKFDSINSNIVKTLN